MNNILPLISALWHIIVFIFIGVFLKRINFLPEAGWQAIEKLSYYVLFPCLLVYSIANIEYRIHEFLPLASALNIAALGMFVISFFAWFGKTMNGPKFTSILQNNIRFNSYVALTILMQYVDARYYPYVALGIGSLIPLVNILSVWSLIIWGKMALPVAVNADANKGAVAKVHPLQKEDPLKSLFQNPLIIGCAIGFSLNFLGIGLNKNIELPMKMLGEAALPIGLIAVGVGLDFQKMKETIDTRLFWVVFRAFVFPIIMVISCSGFGIRDSNIILIALIIAACPTATHSYILSRQMGGDSPLMASFIGTSTLFSAITIPIVMLTALELGIIETPY